MNIIKITSDGQITISPKIREQFGLLPGTEIQIEVIDDIIQIRKSSTRQRTNLVAALRGKATRDLSTDEIMQLTSNN